MGLAYVTRAIFNFLIEKNTSKDKFAQFTQGRGTQSSQANAHLNIIDVVK